MSGRIYDLSEKATCKKCGSEMTLSKHRNFWGPKCKNESCDGGIGDADYELPMGNNTELREFNFDDLKDKIFKKNG